MYNNTCNHHFLQSLLHTKGTTVVLLEKVNATLAMCESYFHLAYKNVIILIFLGVLDVDIPHRVG